MLTLAGCPYIENCVAGKWKLLYKTKTLLFDLNGQNKHHEVVHVCSKIYNSRLIPEDEIECKECKCKKMPAVAKIEKMTVIGRTTGITLSRVTPSYGIRPPRRWRW